MVCSGPSNANVTSLPGNVRRVRPLPGELGRKDQVHALFGRYLQRDLVSQQFLDGRDQQQLLLRFVGNALAVRQPEPSRQRIVLRDEPQPVRLRPGRLHHPRGVCVQQFRLQQHEIPELQPADQPAALHPSDAGLEAGPQRAVVSLLGMRSSESVEQVVGRAEQPPLLLLLDQEVLDPLEQDARADHRQRVPVDAVADRLCELGDLPALLRASLEEPVKPENADHRPDPLRADPDPAPVGTRRDQVRLQRDGCVPLELPGLSQRPCPVLHPGERIGLAARVEDDKRHRHLVEVKLVDDPVTRLPG